MSEVIVLGSYIPSEWTTECIEREFRPLLPPCCQIERISVRYPPAEKLLPHIDNLHWHQDGGGVEGNTVHMVVWASTNPTELMLSSGERVLTSPYDLVLYNNYLARHRWPVYGAINPNRWFVSVRCSKPFPEGIIR